MEQHPRLLAKETAVHLVEVLEVGRRGIKWLCRRQDGSESQNIPTPAGPALASTPTLRWR